MKSKLFFMVGGLMLVLFSYSSAQIPQMINYQGKLTNAQGAPLNTTVQMVFSIYADTITPTPLWSETHSAVVVEKGVFNVLLGSVDSIPYSVFDGSIRYLGVKVGDDPEITPRKQMVSVPYAFRAGSGGGGTDNDWTISGNNMYSAVSGNVGIGTTSPGHKLEVASLNDDAGIRINAGAGKEPIIDFDRSSVGKWRFTVADYGATDNFFLWDRDDNTARLTVKQDGNVGIGTTNPTQKLQVEDGDIFLNTSTDIGGRAIYFDGPSGWTTSYYVKGGKEDDDRRMYIGSRMSGANLVFQTWDGDFSFNSGDPEETHMIIKPGGNIGIGTTTPLSKLTVNGNVGLYDNAIYLRYGGSDTNHGLAYDSVADGARLFGWQGITFGTTHDGYSEKMRINYNGDIGIGMTPTNPAYRLEVNGAIHGNRSVEIDGFTHPNVRLMSTGGGDYRWEVAGGSCYLYDQTSTSYRLYLDSLGRLGVGTNTPGYRLDVNGDIRATGNIYGNFSGTIDNADKVDGIHASTTPTANQLYPLDANTKIPNARLYTGSGNGLDVDKLDGIHASTTPTANYLYPLDANTKIPNAQLYTGSGNGLDADKVDGIHASTTPTANYLYPLDASTKIPNARLYTGSGNGLDADKVDGIHGTSFLRNDQSGTLSGNLSISNDLAVHGRLDAYSYVDLKYYTDIWDLLVWTDVTVFGGALIWGDLDVWGIKSFVQLHPKDTTKTIHYVCLEGGEAGTYIRGSAQLQGGISIVSLPEHFGLVTGENALTAQITPRDGTAKGYLYTESVTPSQLVVRESGGGSSNAKYDYLVQGVRKGYENYQVIQERKMRRDLEQRQPPLKKGENE